MDHEAFCEWWSGKCALRVVHGNPVGDPTQSTDQGHVRAPDGGGKTIQVGHDRVHEEAVDHPERHAKKQSKMENSTCFLTRLLRWNDDNLRFTI